MESLGILFKMWEIPAVRCGEAGWTITSTSTNTKNKVQIQAGWTITNTSTNTNKVQVQIQIQIPAARSEEDGGTDQRPPWLPEQNSQRQVGQADVGHLSVSLSKNKRDMYKFQNSQTCSYEMSWFPDHHPLEKDYNSANSSNHHWPWLVYFPSWFSQSTQVCCLH